MMHARRVFVVVLILALGLAGSAEAQDTLVVENNEVGVFGNLGVGGNPAQRFHVQGADPNVIIADTSGDGSTFLIAGRDTVSFFGTTTPDNFAIRVNNLDVMRFTTAGRVGINTASPTESLHVVGNIRIQGGSLISADYVFEPGYELMPLAELERFIAEKGHLPNVPSGTQIDEEGVNRGTFQMALLEKVEELVLYTLAQEEQLARQEERIETLEQLNQEIVRQNEELQGLRREMLAALAELGWTQLAAAR